MRTRPAVVAAALLPALLLTACSGNSPSAAPSPSATTAAPSPSAASSPPSSPPASSAPAATTAPPFPANTLPDTETATGEPLGLAKATSAVQTGYDRVVYTLGGTQPGQPGWRVEYVATATSDGSGNTVAVAGPVTLQVLLQGVGSPPDTGVADPSPRRFTPSGTQVVREVVLDGYFEGQWTSFIGLSAKKPFRVFRLSNPPRVVVDVRHS